VGEGGEEVLMVSNVAKDIFVLVSEDTIFFWPSVLGVAGGPFFVGLKRKRCRVPVQRRIQ